MPHGRYLASGHVAGEVYSRVASPTCAVILASSHTGQGNPWSIVTKGTWLTPLGGLGIQTELAQSILDSSSDLLESDAPAHRYEHAIEVQLPFVQRLGKVRWFVPIQVGNKSVEQLEQTGLEIAQVIQKSELETLLINSTQMSCYEPQQDVIRKDKELLEPVLALDGRKFLETAQQLNSSCCGIASTAVMLFAAKSLGACKATLVKYETSGDVSGDAMSVVGYAGITIQ